MSVTDVFRPIVRFIFTKVIQKVPRPIQLDKRYLDRILPFLTYFFATETHLV